MCDSRAALVLRGGTSDMSYFPAVRHISRQEFMEPVGLLAYALAKALGVPLPRVNDIVREKRAISAEMAVLLSKYFSTSDGHWINLQSHFDLEMAKDRLARQAARIQPHPRAESGTLQPVRGFGVQ